MHDLRLDRAAKKSAMPASPVLLTSTFHASIIFALLWLPLAKGPAFMPEDAVQLTIELQPVAAADPPVVSPPVQPPAPVPEPSAPKVEAAPAPTPTLESAVPEPEPVPQPTLRDFPKTEPVIAKSEQKKPAPTPGATRAPQPESNKALVPPPAATPQPASPSTPPPNQAGIDPSKINERAARLWGTKYFERMGIRPSHQATLTDASGRTCPQDPEPYKLEIVNNKLTVTNDYGIMFSIKVSVNGEIDEIYKRAPMAGDHATDHKGTWMKYRMMGNVKSGKLEIWLGNCVYKLSVY
jgi:hypothetical protein